MAGEKQEEAKRRLAELGAMTLDEVAAFAAANPDSVYAQVAQIEIRRRVAQAQIDAADALRHAARAEAASVGGLLPF
jgi:hypothetical protein